MYSQEPVYLHLEGINGSPGKEFYRIVEGANGLIWLAGDKGLFSFNGKDFKSYNNKKQKGLSVFNLQEDNSKRIWCNNLSGQFFYVDKHELKLFIDLGKKTKGQNFEFVIKENNLIVFLPNEILVIDIKTKKTTFLNIPSKFSWTVQKNNTIHLVVPNNINRTVKNTDLIKILKIEKSKIIDASSRGRAKLFAVDKDFFLITNDVNGKNVFFKFNDLDQKSMKLIGDFETLKDKTIASTHLFGNEIWFTTNEGVWVFNITDGVIKFKNKFLSNFQVTYCIRDRDKNYLLATKNNGILIIPSTNIESCFGVENNLNITCLDKLSDHSLVYGTSKGNIGFYNTITRHNFLVDIPTSERVSNIKYLPSTNSVVISKDKGGFEFNCKNKKLIPITAISISNVKSFTLLNNKDVLYTTYNYSMLIKENTFSKVNQTIISTGKRTYTSHFNKKDNSVLIGFVDNLKIYDSLWNNKNITYNNKPIYAKDITQSLNEITWVSTFKNGIYSIKKDSVINNYTTADGLSSNRINKIKADKDFLWISTENSIQKLNLKTDKIETFTTHDGIPSYNITGIQIIRDKVYFSSNDGLFSINRENLKKQYNQEIQFTALEINQSQQPLKQSYNLNYQQNSIKISFNVNGIYYNEKGRYQYRLKGYNNKWLVTDIGENYVKYNSLPAGDYTFQVKPLLNDQKVFNAHIKQIEFSIKKPIWKAWWFIIGLSALLLLIVISYYKKEIRKQEKIKKDLVRKIELEKELISSNLRALRSQMNPHFIFNTLNSIQDLVLREDTEASYDYIVLFAGLMRSILNYSDKDFIPLEKELEFLNIYLKLEKLRFGDDFEYTIKNNIGKKLEIPSLLIQPFIENALVHGLLHKNGKKKLDISFVYSDTLKCIITDNGIGRSKASEIANRQGNKNESFALKAIEKRLKIYEEKYGQKLKFIIEDLFDLYNPSGTKITITLPNK